MIGLVVDHGVHLQQELPVPRPDPGEALIKIRLAGICSTDLEMIKGYYPFQGVLGHEFVGEVGWAEDPGWIGKRVVGEINLACRACPTCQAGYFRHCPHRKVLGMMDKDGIFAEYCTLPLVNLHKVPDSIPDERAVFAEPLAAALEVLEQITLLPGTRVFLVGAGRLGLLVAQVLAQTACDLRVAVRQRSRAAHLARWGIQAVSVDDLPGAWADVGVDCTGSAEGFDLVRDRVRPRGTIILKSTFVGAASINLSRVVVDEQTLIGSRCGPFDKALDWLARERVDVDSLIVARYPLTDALAALAHAAQPGALKVLLQPD